MEAFARCQAVVFDAYGTLFDVAAPTAVLLGDRAEAVGQLWRRKQLEYSWLRSLMGRHADFAQVTAEALAYAFDASGIHDPALAEQLLAAYRTLPAFADAKPVLAALADSGRKLAILSNGSPAMLAPMVSASGLADLIPNVLSVEEANVFKPHPKVYALACERLSLRAAEIAFVSANGWDAAGAAAFGFTVAWLNRRSEPQDRLPGHPAAHIASLAELPTLFGVAR
jgi:2-haloacid dehalogenase